MPHLHSGHALLRALICNDRDRRAYVARACAEAAWNEADLVRTAIRDNGRHPTSTECARVRSFIESI